MTLKKTFEKKKKNIEFKYKHNPYTIFEKQIEILQWVLSELEKMTCDNCKKKENCASWISGINDVTYCSEWKIK